MRVFFAGGGTGGHLYPALAIARSMVALDPKVRPFFIGAERGIEREVLKTTEFEFELLDLHPLYRTQPWLNVKTLLGTARSWRRVAALAADSKPLSLVATGGYAAATALAFAARRRIPIVLQEQNSFPGLTVKLFARRAAQIHLGFPEAAAGLTPGAQTELFVSGNPIEPPVPVPSRPPRPEVEASWGFAPSDRRVLLIFGGSQGSEVINRAVAEWLGMANEARPRVIWATGAANYDSYAALERDDVRVRPYLSPMRDAYLAADLVLSRAGAMTTAELAAWGLPAILIPLPTAAADHQTANALAMSSAGAATLLRQRDLSAASLGGAVMELASDPTRLQAMRSAALARARPNAAQDIAAHVLTMRCFK